MDPGENGPTRRLVYSNLLSRRQNRYRTDANCGVLHGTECRLAIANTIEQPVCGGDAALYQIDSTTHFSTAVLTLSSSSSSSSSSKIL